MIKSGITTTIIDSILKLGVLTSEVRRSVYAVGAKEPDLAFDFAANKYIIAGSESAISDAVAYTGASNKTMVDSDGLLKWAPHNLSAYSDDLTQWNADAGATIIDSETFSTIAGGAGVTNLAATTISPGKYILEIEMWSETDAGEFVDIGFSTNNFSNTFSSPIELQSTPTLHSFERTETASPAVSVRVRNQDALAKTVKIRNVRIYRIDLGGMVDNPDRGDSYVPTTTSARYLPRRGHHVYNGTAWVNEGLLVESEARTNLVTYSQDFTQWVNFGSSDAANTTTSPDGENSASTLTVVGTGTFKYIIQSIALTQQAYTLSVYLKYDGSAQWAWLLGETSINTFFWFDLANGVLGSSGTQGGAPIAGQDYSHSIENVGGGWYRCSATFTKTSADATEQLGFGLSDADASVAATDAISMHMWGAQLEAGSTPSSHIPNAGTLAGVSRAAETLTISAANLPYSSIAMSIQLNGLATGDSLTTTRWNLDANNEILQQIGTSDFTFTQEASGVVDSVTGGSFTSGINTPFSIASRHTSSVINAAIDGVALTANATPTALPNLSSSNLSLAYDYMGTIKMFRMWSQDLGNAGIESATA
jgi:hypothetical protein